MDEIVNSQDLYNTPVELGVRCLLTLKSNSKSEYKFDLDRLMYFDYISVFSGDLSGPTSMHAPVPNRGVQVYARRDLIKRGLALLISKELLDVSNTEDGIYYEINENGLEFLTYFDSSYFLKLVERVNWTSKEFGVQSTSQIEEYINNNLHKWGSDLVEDYNRLTK